MHAFLVRVRESFWFLPALLGLVAVVAAQLLVTLDRDVLAGQVPAVPFLDALSAGGGRSILTTIGTAMLTVAGTSFSITISVLATTIVKYPQLTAPSQSINAKVLQQLAHLRQKVAIGFRWRLRSGRTTGNINSARPPSP